MFAIERLEADWIEPFTEFRANMEWFLKHRKEMVEKCITTVEENGKPTHVLAIMNPEQMRRILQRVWDPTEFRSDYGLRSLSKCHAENPFWFGSKKISYEPAESAEKLKGGNSNWRGPIWFPMTFMMIESLRKLRKAYGNSFNINEGNGKGEVQLDDLARGFAESLIAIFARNAKGERPVFGDSRLFQSNPHWNDCLQFFEYFHGDTGKGLGASHQTGWTALIACVIDEWRK